MENWKEIQGYEEYQISDLGNIKTTANNASRKEKILKPLKAGKGYFRVALWKNNKAKFISIHRLVAMHFILNPDNKKTVNHIDGNKSNNTVVNLEWCTDEENKKHAIENNLYKLLDNHSRAILNIEKVKEIRYILQTQKRTVRSIAKDFNVKEGVIHAIKQNKSWKNV